MMLMFKKQKNFFVKNKKTFHSRQNTPGQHKYCNRSFAFSLQLFTRCRTLSVRAEYHYMSMSRACGRKVCAYAY